MFSRSLEHIFVTCVIVNLKVKSGLKLSSSQSVTLLLLAGGAATVVDPSHTETHTLGCVFL